MCVPVYMSAACEYENRGGTIKTTPSRDIRCQTQDQEMNLTFYKGDTENSSVTMLQKAV